MQKKVGKIYIFEGGETMGIFNFFRTKQQTNNSELTQTVSEEETKSTIDNQMSEYAQLLEGLQYYNQSQYKIDWLMESINKGREIDNCYVLTSAEENLPYFCESEWEYEMFHNREKPVLKDSIQGIMDIAFFYNPCSENFNDTKRTYWLRKLINLAEGGNREAQAALGSHRSAMNFSVETQIEFEELYGEKLWEDAQNGDKYAEIAVGEWLTGADRLARKEWLRKAAEQGLTDAYYYLSCECNGDRIVDETGKRREEPLSEEEKNILNQKYVELIKKGAELNNGTTATFCKNSLAGFYEDGFVVNKNKEMAILWYRRAAEDGDSSALRSAEFLELH